MKRGFLLSFKVKYAEGINLLEEAHNIRWLAAQ